MSNLTKYQPHNQDEQAIIDARPNRIANIDIKDSYRQVLNTLSALFPIYGIDGDIAFYSTVTKEIIKTFGQIAANEIEIAFRLFAAQSLDLDEDVKFYGKANMHTIGKILNAYLIYRRKIIAAHDNEVAALRHNANMEERARKTREELYANFPTMLKEFKGKDYTAVPLYWYDMCLQFDMVTYEEGEKRALWEEAKELALKEPPENMDLMSIRSHAKKIEQGNLKRAAVIAQQLAVWRKVLKR
jgi:hypothetical protein